MDHFIDYSLRSLMHEVLKMNNKMKMLTEAFQKKSPREQVDLNMDELAELKPMATFEELELFNDQLKDDEYFTRMLNQLKYLGGRNERDITRRLMAKLVNHELALSMNWSGRYGKPSFGTLSVVMKLIFAVVKSTPPCSSVTHSEIQNIIQIWLRNAGDRQGGRMLRRLLKADASG